MLFPSVLLICISMVGEYSLVPISARHKGERGLPSNI